MRIWRWLLFVPLFLLSFAVASTQESRTIDNTQPFFEEPLNITADGSIITLDLKATSGDLDTLLYLVDTNGVIVASNDDRIKDDTNSLIVYPKAGAGNYTIIATRYGVTEGETSGTFDLSVSVSDPPVVSPLTITETSLLSIGYPEINPRPSADWTVLAYYGGDTNLEASILNDLNEFEVGGGSTDRVRIIAFVDRHPAYTEADGNWTDGRIYEVNADASADTIDSTLLFELDDPDSGSGETLAQFLVWAIWNYPASNYAISFGSHGAGWEGLITDDTAGETIISVPELVRALDATRDATEIDEFALLINDACLMSSVEYYGAVSQFFRYSLASPEVVVNPALDMTTLVELLNNNPDLSLPDLGETLVDLYLTRDAAGAAGDDAKLLSHAVTDLNAFDPVVTAVEDFAALINSDMTRYGTLIGEARSNTYTYSFFLGDDRMIDLGDFMRQVISQTDDEAVIQAALSVITALDEARVYGNAGEQVASLVNYYNIFFPEDSTEFNPQYFIDSPLQSWAQMLRSYFNTVTPQVWVTQSDGTAIHPPLIPKIRTLGVYPDVVSYYTQANIAMEAIGRNINRMNYTVDQVQPDGTLWRLSAGEAIQTEGVGFESIETSVFIHGVDQGAFAWDVIIDTVSDGDNTNPELVRGEGDTRSLDGRYQLPNGEWKEVTVVFDDASGTVERVVSRNDNSGAVAVITIPPGTRFQVFRQIVTVDGRVVPEPGNTYIWGVNGLQLDIAPAPNGEYELGFEIVSFGGASAFASSRVTVNNDGVDFSLNTLPMLEEGYYLLYPETWYDFDFVYTDDAFYVLGVSDDEATNIQVFHGMGPIDDGMVDYLDYLGVYVDSDFEPMTVDGIEGFAFDIIYEDIDNLWYGWGFAFIPIGGDEDYGAVVVTVRSIDGVNDYEDIYDLVLSTIQLNDVTDVDASYEAAAWIEPEEDIYPAYFVVPVDWDETQDGAWLRFTAPDSSTTFAAYTTTGLIEPDALLDKQLGASVPDRTNESRQTYYGPRVDWRVALYNREVNGQQVSGRMYAATIEDTAYAMWFESSDPTVFADVFEPIADSLDVDVYDLLGRERLRYDFPEYGFTMLVPTAWYSMGYDPATDLVFASSYDEFAWINVKPTGSLAQEGLNNLINAYSAFEDTITIGEPTEIAGRSAIPFSFEADFGDDWIHGIRGFAVDGLVFFAEVAFDTPAETRLDQLYEFIVINTTIAADTLSDAPRFKTLNDREYGFSIQYPAEWYDMSWDDEYQEYYTSTLDELLYVYVNPLPDVAADEVVAETEYYFDETISEFDFTTEGSYEIYELTFEYDEDGQPGDALQIAIYDQQSGFLVFLSFYSLDPNLDLHELYDLILPTLSFEG